MVYTLKTLLPLVGTRKFPQYLLLISCIEAEKPVLEANLDHYLDTVNCLLLDENDQKEHLIGKDEPLHKAIYKRVIGQIIPNRERTICDYFVLSNSFISIAPSECTLIPSVPHFNYLFEQILTDLVGGLIYKMRFGFENGDDFSADMYKRATVFLGDLMILGYNKTFAISAKAGGSIGQYYFDFPPVAPAATG